MEKHLKTAEFLAKLLDNRFKIFGVSFGINALLDVIPEIGDIIAALLSLYLVWIAIKLRVPAFALLAMVGNIAVNFILGIIPVVGEITYIFRKANLKNLAIIKKYAQNPDILEGKIVHQAL